MKKIIQRILELPKIRAIIEWKRIIFKKYENISYSQEGEDRILARFLGSKPQGFFIDVGAHHPIRFSNTYFFYKLGWSGINIDATPGSMRLFRLLRPRDTNLEIAIAAEEKTRELIIFNDSALNSFDRELSNIQENTSEYRVLNIEKIQTSRLEDVLAKCIEPGREIDFLSVDVEGLDLEVLKSNNWRLFRPKYVLVECINFDFERIEKDDVFEFMLNQEYRLVSKTYYTAIFRDRSITS